MNKILSREAVEEALLPAISATFAEMTFIDVESTAEAPPACRWNFSAVLTMPHRGILAMACDDSVMQQCVENVFADAAAALGDAARSDCLIEIFNVFAGNLLAALYPEGYRFDVPRAYTDMADTGLPEGSYAFRFNAQDGVLAVYMGLTE